MNKSAKIIPGIPEQQQGGFHDTESKKCFDNPEIAAEKFQILKERLFSVNSWKEYSGIGAEFRLFNPQGEAISAIPEESNYIRIDIPGPGDIEANGFDWVNIRKISTSFTKENEVENILIECGPSIDPTQPGNSHIAHFYNQEATSTFVISRSRNCLHAAIYGRNEIPNTRQAAFVDKIRNTMVASLGMVGLSKIQWKLLTDGLLDF